VTNGELGLVCLSYIINDALPFLTRCQKYEHYSDCDCCGVSFKWEVDQVDVKIVFVTLLMVSYMKKYLWSNVNSLYLKGLNEHIVCQLKNALYKFK